MSICPTKLPQIILSSNIMPIRATILRALAMSWVMEIVAAPGGPSCPALEDIRCLEPCCFQSNGFHSKISLGSSVSAANRAMNIAAAINTPK